jgi:putative ABC transport system permease protein
MLIDGQAFRMLLKFAWEGITFRSGRSFLTVVGMAAGTASVVAVVSIGLAGRGYVVGLIEGVGANLVVARGTGQGVNPEFITFDDADALSQSLRGLGTVAPVAESSRTISISGQPWPINVIGVTPPYADVRNLVIGQGRFFGAPEEDGSAKVAVISRELARRLYRGPLPPNANLRLFDLRFRVIGVFEEAVGTAAAVNRSEAAGLSVLIPYSTKRQLHDSPEVDIVYMQASSPEAISQLMRSAEHVLSSRHRSMESIEVESLAPFIDLARAVSGAIGLVLLAAAGVSLIVGGIGIMNIMLVTVRERTRDIGIRLALGARRGDILVQFLLEAALLSTVGGALGVLLGGGVPLLIGTLLGIPVPVSLISIATAFAVCVGVGLVFGVHPARRAAAMNIVDSLAYE